MSLKYFLLLAYIILSSVVFGERIYESCLSKSDAKIGYNGHLYIRDSFEFSFIDFLTTNVDPTMQYFRY